jgi:hypothetical protein
VPSGLGGLGRLAHLVGGERRHRDPEEDEQYAEPGASPRHEDRPEQDEEDAYDKVHGVLERVDHGRMETGPLQKLGDLRLC